MKTALRELLKSPQNNLKIFKEGFVVYDQESSPSDLDGVLDEWFRNGAAAPCILERTRVDQFCDLVFAALTRPVREQLKLFTASRPCNFLLPTNQVPTFCAEPDVIARVEKCLRLAGQVSAAAFETLPFIVNTRLQMISRSLCVN